MAEEKKWSKKKKAAVALGVAGTAAGGYYLTRRHFKKKIAKDAKKILSKQKDLHKNTVKRFSPSEWTKKNRVESLNDVLNLILDGYSVDEAIDGLLERDYWGHLTKTAVKVGKGSKPIIRDRSKLLTMTTKLRPMKIKSSRVLKRTGDLIRGTAGR